MFGTEFERNFGWHQRFAFEVIKETILEAPASNHR